MAPASIVPPNLIPGVMWSSIPMSQYKSSGSFIMSAVLESSSPGWGPPPVSSTPFRSSLKSPISVHIIWQPRPPWWDLLLFTEPMENSSCTEEAASTTSRVDSSIQSGHSAISSAQAGPHHGHIYRTANLPPTILWILVQCTSDNADALSFIYLSLYDVFCILHMLFWVVSRHAFWICSHIPLEHSQFI